MSAFAALAEPAPYRRHALHATARDWPETNCSADLWIVLLHLQRLEPTAVLGFLVALDWEGDQFTFFKPLPEDLRRLYGATVQELALYEDTEAHVTEQLRRGHTVLLEVDAWFLPDVAGVAYRRQHTKTTIAILGLDPMRRRLRYIHNSGVFDLADEDYAGVLGCGKPELSLYRGLFPYAEVVRFPQGAGAAHRTLRDTAAALLTAHLQARLPGSPVRDFAADLPRHLKALAGRDGAALHRFSFNTLRQLGAACELLAGHLSWLEIGASASIEAALDVSAGAKALQVMLAHQLRRGVTTAPADALDRLATAHDRLFDGLHTRFA